MSTEFVFNPPPPLGVDDDELPEQPAPASVVYFNSGSKGNTHLLSNFSYAPIVVQRADLTPALLAVNPRLAEWIGNDVWTFDSSEHLWQALKATSKETFAKFLTLGAFGRHDAVAFAPFFPKEAAKKAEYWNRKHNVGVVPKMAANPKYGKTLGIKASMNYAAESLPPDQERVVWLAILVLKYRQNAAHRAALLETGTARLVEFDRGAARAHSHVHWGGLIAPDGSLRGENVMGRYMGETRSLLTQ